MSTEIKNLYQLFAQRAAEHGDDPAFFYMIVSENDRMREMGVENYRNKARQKLKKFR